MIFQAKWDNSAYVVRSTIRTVNAAGGVQITPGLRAEFKGAQRLFDSVKAQERYAWTDEERERVEKHMLKHKDFGNGIYLAPGQELPEAMADIPKRSVDRARCAHVVFKDGLVSQCEEVAMVGGAKCSEHRDDRVGISRGMVTAPENR